MNNNQRIRYDLKLDTWAYELAQEINRMLDRAYHDGYEEGLAEGKRIEAQEVLKHMEGGA